MSLQPRVIRMRDAPDYLGMDRNRFNREVRPKLIEMRFGTQCIAFDRLDLDAWLDDHKARNGRPGQQTNGDQLWDEKERQASLKEAKHGTSIKSFKGGEFDEAVKQIPSVKRKPT